MIEIIFLELLPPRSVIYTLTSLALTINSGEYVLLCFQLRKNFYFSKKPCSHFYRIPSIIILNKGKMERLS